LGFGGGATGGTGGEGNPSGVSGTAAPGNQGGIDTTLQSFGGGMAIFAKKATGDNVRVTGNNAITFPNIDGTLST
jgi:hypothetical protein